MSLFYSLQYIQPSISEDGPDSKADTGLSIPSPSTASIYRLDSSSPAPTTNLPPSSPTPTPTPNREPIPSITSNYEAKGETKDEGKAEVKDEVKDEVKCESEVVHESETGNADEQRAVEIDVNDVISKRTRARHSLVDVELEELESEWN